MYLILITRMWKFVLVFLAVVNFGAPEYIDKFIGSWYPILSYPSSGLSSINCLNLQVSKGLTKCNCDGRKTTSLILTIHGWADYTRGLSVENTTDVNAALNITCECDGLITSSYNTVYYSFDSDHFVIYYLDTTGTVQAMWFAKQIPTDKEINEFVKTTDEDGTYDVLCASYSGEKSSKQNVGSSHKREFSTGTIRNMWKA